MNRRIIIYCVIGINLLLLFIALILCISSQKCKTVSYEFEYTPGNNIVMEIEALKEVEYQIEPLEDMIVSEPSPDWGISVYLGDRSSSLYFYASRSPGGYEGIYVEEAQPLESVKVGGRQLRLIENGGYIEGDYRIASEDGGPFCYGVCLYIEKSIWEKDRKKIIRLIESARVHRSENYQ